LKEDKVVSIEKYADLIKSLPVGGQFTKIKRGSKFWDPTNTEFSDDVKEVVKAVFDECSGDNNYIKISRDDIKKTSDTKKKIIKILMWGYPGGGRYGQVQNILQNIDVLTNWLEENNGNNFDSVQDDALDNLSEINGLGLSTISKLLYFFDVKIGNNPCQIYDGKVINSLNKNHQIQELSERNNWGRTYDDYEDYIDLLFRLSNDYQCSPDQIELFLFMINNSFNLSKDEK
jgi:hypothetical protein